MSTPSPADRNPPSADAPTEESAALDIALHRCQHCNNVLHKEDGDGEELCVECTWDWAIR